MLTLMSLLRPISSINVGICYTSLSEEDGLNSCSVQICVLCMCNDRMFSTVILLVFDGYVLAGVYVCTYKPLHGVFIRVCLGERQREISGIVS